MSKSIDLGMKYDSPEVAPAKDNAEKVHFPSLYVDSEEDLSQLPDEGTMTICYKVRNRSKNENQDGDVKHSITIDVTSIESFEAEDDEDGNGNSGDSGEANLDKLAEEEMASRKSAE